ncbi:SAM-dependent methyltransferase [Rugosimonospora africana]|uniref:SAM-dependent methyltransferase n=1 Tax=Rugosimonospora africana TaxID=556532 RepID=UPI001EF2643A|nr:SAM-dependent methyltransferase [Rugosimonospora africana]
MSSQDSQQVAGGRAERRIDTSVAHPARRYDYWLGGKDNFAADRASGDAVAAAFPTVRTAVLENRKFLHRAVTHLARDFGIRQFLDIGTGIPTSPNTHQIAQGYAPDARIVYVDNDPIVLAHARALLSSTPEGATAYLDADLREPDKIIDHPELRRTIDLSQPVGLMLVSILHFIADSDDPYGTVARLVRAMPSGSYLTITHVTGDYFSTEESTALLNANNNRAAVDLHLRSHGQVARFFQDLELVEPGIAPVAEWRAEQAQEPRPPKEDVSGWAAVARIP